MTNSAVRVRFAPSPTGALHVGSGRTALFNWLFAKHHGGTFVLRIEDTDQQRSNPAFLKDIDAGLDYLGIHPDEGPYFQAKRVDLYTEQAEKLLSAGKAVREDGAVIFPVEQGKVTFKDRLRGDITVDTSLFEKIVCIKSDGFPAYNFACAVDDGLMKISHVIRGDDHIANTPKQVVIYEALGLPLPEFIHIPLIVGADRARLSKRTGATSVTAFKEAGYLSDAFVNYLALLGWSPGGDREFMPPDEIIRIFDLDRVKKTAAQFDQRKLDWLNGQYLKKMSEAQLAKVIGERLREKGLIQDGYDTKQLARIAGLLKERLKVLSELEEDHRFLFEEPQYQPEAVEQFLKQEGMRNRLNTLIEQLKGISGFEVAEIEQVMRSLMSENNWKPKQLIHPARVAISGRSVSPPLFETMSILGKETVCRRLGHAAQELTEA